jgi:hypothetical protein
MNQYTQWTSGGSSKNFSNFSSPGRGLIFVDANDDINL